MGFHFRTPAEAEVKVLWAGLEVVCRWDAAELDTWDAPMAGMTQSQSGTFRFQFLVNFGYLDIMVKWY
jgi:hypothetical protein